MSTINCSRCLKPVKVPGPDTLMRPAELHVTLTQKIRCDACGNIMQVVTLRPASEAGRGM